MRPVCVIYRLAIWRIEQFRDDAMTSHSVTPSGRDRLKTVLIGLTAFLSRTYLKTL
jgi:hypothetical protein